MFRDTRPRLGAGYLAALALVTIAQFAFADGKTFAQAAKPTGSAATFAQAAFLKGNAGTFAWASHSCPCGPNCPCPEGNCQCNTPKMTGVEWKQPEKGDPNAGKVIYLVQPKHCYGTFCTPEKVIGGWSVPDHQYRAFDGQKWGPATAPPLPPPHVQAEAVLASLLVGLVYDEVPIRCDTDKDCPNCPPNSSQAPPSSSCGGGTATSRGGAGVVFAVAERRHPLRRLLSAPFRALRAMRHR